VAAATGLWRWRPGSPVLARRPNLRDEVHSIVDGDQGIDVAVSRDVLALSADGNAGASVPLGVDGLKPTTLLRDRNGALWIGTQDRGLIHVRGNRIDRYSRVDGLSGDFVTDLFEDREGSVWVATLNGLDQFRDLVVATVSTKQ